MNITFSNKRIANFVLGQKPINKFSVIFVNRAKWKNIKNKLTQNFWKINTASYVVQVATFTNNL